MARSSDELVFAPLGGVGEIGMNLALYGFGDERRRQWIIVDFGVAFAGEDVSPRSAASRSTPWVASASSPSTAMMVGTMSTCRTGPS
jgi:mRNA degradation ribonuclease J1/J2